MFKGVEPTKYIQLAYITGILPIKKEKTQSALNNFDEFTMLSAGAFASYIGFTDDEVKALCKNYNKDFEKVKRWYDGYILEEYQVYNPKAVVSVLLKGSFKSYWSETASYDAIVPLINMNYDGLKTSIIEMLSGDTIKAVSYTHLGYAATMRVENVFSLIFVSIGNAVSPYVSQNLGANKPRRIKKGYKAALVLDMCFAAIAFIVIETLHTQISSLFLGKDGTALAYQVSGDYMRWLGYFFIFMGIKICLLYTSRCV